MAAISVATPVRSVLLQNSTGTRRHLAATGFRHQLCLPAQRRICCMQRKPAVACGAAAAAPGQPVSPLQPPPAVSLLAAASVSLWKQATANIAQLFKKLAERLHTSNSEEVNATIRSSVKNMRTMAMFAAMGVPRAPADTVLVISRAVGSFLRIYLLLLFLRVLLSWFPVFNWSQQPWLALRQVTDPYLNLFRGLVPPLMGTIDFTPLLGFFILQYLSSVFDMDAGGEMEILAAINGPNSVSGPLYGAA